MPRISNEVTVTIAQGAALSDEFDFGEFASGIVIFPAAWTTADLGLHVAGDKANTTFVPLQDFANLFGETVSIDAVAASTARPIPDWWFGARKAKLFSHNGTGTGVNQAAARTITIKLKD